MPSEGAGAADGWSPNEDNFGVDDYDYDDLDEDGDEDGDFFAPIQGMLNMHDTKELVRLADQAALAEFVDEDDHIAGLLASHIDRYLDGGDSDWLLPTSPVPSPEQRPEEVVRIVLKALKDTQPHEAHGAAVALRFSLPLAKSELEWEPPDPWRRMMRRAATWAQEQGATHMSVIYTQENEAANGLYTSLGMALTGTYHYRIKG